MPTASYNERRKRRLKRNNSLLRQEIKTLQRDWQARQESQAAVLIHLFSVLAQKGGEVVVTKGTIDQVVQNLGHMSYKVDKGETEREFVFRLVIQEVPTEQVDTPAPVLSVSPVPPVLPVPDAHLGVVDSE